MSINMTVLACLPIQVFVSCVLLEALPCLNQHTTSAVGIRSSAASTGIIGFSRARTIHSPTMNVSSSCSTIPCTSKIMLQGFMEFLCLTNANWLWSQLIAGSVLLEEFFSSLPIFREQSIDLCFNPWVRERHCRYPLASLLEPNPVAQLSSGAMLRSFPTLP